jgi:HEAT repeat protein
MRDPSYVHILPQFLASDEAFVRNHAVEAWQSLGTNDAFMAAALLTHPDRDVRILAITVLRVVPGKLIEPYLLTLLEMEGDPSVCAAAVDLLAELGSDEGIEVLRELAKRFNDEDSLRFAIDMAIVQMGESNDFADVV